MQHIAQGQNECVVASIAFLSGLTPATIKKDFKEAVNDRMPYRTLIRCGWEVWARAVEKVTRKRLGRGWRPNNDRTYRPKIHQPMYRHRKAMKERCGILTYSMGEGRGSHAIAYSHGWVNDGNFSALHSVDDYIELQSDRYLHTLRRSFPCEH